MLSVQALRSVFIFSPRLLYSIRRNLVGICPKARVEGMKKEKSLSPAVIKPCGSGHDSAFTD